MRVVLTRPEREARSWVTALAEAGMDAVALPLIVVAGSPDLDTVQNAWLKLAQFDALMFVSGNAVDYFFKQKPAAAPDWPAQAAIKTRAFVTGPGSRAALLGNGVGADRIDAPSAAAGQFDSEALWELVGARVVPGYQVLIVRGAGSVNGSGDGAGRDWFARQVQSRGGSVDLWRPISEAAPPGRQPSGSGAPGGDGWFRVAVQQFGGDCQFKGADARSVLAAGTGGGHASAHRPSSAQGRIWCCL